MRPAVRFAVRSVILSVFLNIFMHGFYDFFAINSLSIDRSGCVVYVQSKLSIGFFRDVGLRIVVVPDA